MLGTIKILYIDDNPMDYELVSVALKPFQNISLIYVKTLEDFILELNRHSFSLIIADYNLQFCYGTDIIPYVKEKDIDLPFILLSGTVGEERIIEMMRLGVTDFIQKNKLDKMIFVIKRALEEYDTKTQKRIQYEEIQRKEKLLAQSNFELEAIDKINRVIIENGTPSAVYLILLNSLNIAIGIDSSQVYEYNHFMNKLFLLGESTDNGLIKTMEKTFNLTSEDVTPILTQNSYYANFLKERKNVFIENEEEVLSVLSSHVDMTKQCDVNKILSLLKIKTIGMLPISIKDDVLAVITFHSSRILSEQEKGYIQRFSKQASIVIDKLHIQDSLKKSEEKYRIFFEKNQGLLCTHETDGKLITVNEPVAKSLNYSIAELVGNKIQDFLHPSAKEKFGAYLDEINSKKNSTGYMALVSKSGEKKIWYYTNFLYEGAGERYIIATAQDVTDTFLVKEERLKSKILEEESKEIKKLADELKLYSGKLKSSIDYAKRLKESIHINESTFKKIFENSFIIDMPKEIIGGDFYWLNIKNGKIILALADCTGHGVPGAILATMGATMLDYVISSEDEINSFKIVEKLNFNWRKSFNFNSNKLDNYDGMELSLLCIDMKKKEIDYSGMGGSIIIFQNNLMTKYNGAEGGLNSNYRIFSNHQQKVNLERTIINYNLGDRVYMFSDGFYDQFSDGEENVKLGMRKFKELLGEIQEYSMSKQKELINNFFFKWKGNANQIDDVMIIGVQL